MAVISFVGKVDKRILAFPLIRALSIEGKTVVYTDDSNFKNLFASTSNIGVVEDITIIYESNIKNIEETNYISELGKHIIYVYTDAQYENSDVVFNCNSYDRSFQPDRFELEEEKPENQIDLIFSSIPLRKVPNVLVMKPSFYQYLLEIEEKKEFLILKDKEINTFLANKISGKVDMSKEQFMKLLSRKRYPVITNLKRGS